jgi:recombination protein RecA
MADEIKFLTLAQVRRAIDKKHPGALIQGSDLKNLVIPRITTGSLSLDVMYGGGLPANQFNEIVGEFSSGKTSTVYKTIAANQAIDPEWFVVWVASEPFVASWAESAGCDLDRIEVIDNNIIEEAFPMLLEFVKNRLCDCVVIDSLPQMVPSDENDTGLEGWQMGLAARLNNKFFRVAGTSAKRSLVTDERKCTFLVINQFREKIGVTHGDNRTTPGGKGKDFAYFTKTEVRRKEWIEVNKVRVGVRIAARTVKNKSAPPQRAAEINFYFADTPGFKAGDYDVADDLVGTAAYTDVIYRVDGGTTYWYDGSKLGVGLAKTLTMVREDLGLQRAIRARTLQVTASSYAPDMDPKVLDTIMPEPEPVKPKVIAPKKVVAKKKLAVKRAS